jgi:PKD repeat protein
MRSIPLMAATTVIVALASACGGGSNTGPNNDPVANFTVGACTINVACTFTDASTDPEGNNTITTRKWNFGDATLEVTDPALTQSHTFASAGTFQVTLTVTDNGGLSNSKTNPVIVATANQPPVASFVSPSCTAGAACPFSSTSTDADGSIAATATHWEFGEPSSPNNTADGLTASHTYAGAGTFNVTLTVTDDKGLPGTVTQPVTVAAASQECAVSGLASICTFNITSQANVTVTLTLSQCELGGSRFSITSPIRQIVFFNGCLKTLEGNVYTLNGTFNAGTAIVAQFTPGQADPGDPTPGPSLIRVEGSFPRWILHIDDGGAPGLPRNDDMVLTIDAT